MYVVAGALDSSDSAIDATIVTDAILGIRAREQERREREGHI